MSRFSTLFLLEALIFGTLDWWVPALVFAILGAVNEVLFVIATRPPADEA